MVKYLALFPKIDGWVDHIDIYLTGYLSKIQHTMFNITGPVGEIGVHHGKFTIPIALFAAKNERIWAAENIDKSGMGNMQMFFAHLRDLGILGDGDNATSTLYIQTVNSLSLDSSDLGKRKFVAFRFLSIGGGHTHTATLNDLMFACDIVMNGTIIVVDDFPRPDWIGVASGLFAFLNGQSLLQPFLFSRNKVYLTTESHRNEYIASLEATSINCKPKRKWQLERSGLFPSNFCALDCGNDKTCGIANTLALKQLVAPEPNDTVYPPNRL